MIPCYVCGKDASAGWTTGFAPAPDSQKLALCPEHDTPGRRQEVAEAWKKQQVRELTAFSLVAEQKAAPGKMLATVHFTGGGMLSFTCRAVSPTGHGTLKVEQLDGTLTFLPMQHIREYSLRSYAPGENNDPEHAPSLPGKLE